MYTVYVQYMHCTLYNWEQWYTCFCHGRATVVDAARPIHKQGANQTYVSANLMKHVLLGVSWDRSHLSSNKSTLPLYTYMYMYVTIAQVRNTPRFGPYNIYTTLDLRWA